MNSEKRKIPFIESYETFLFCNDSCRTYKNPFKLSESDYLKKYMSVCTISESLFSEKRPHRKDKTMVWKLTIPSNWTLYCRLIASMCFKKGKPLSQPQSLKSLALLLSTESRRKTNKLFFIIIQLLSESSLFYHCGNVSKINNKGWFL